MIPQAPLSLVDMMKILGKTKFAVKIMVEYQLLDLNLQNFPQKIQKQVLA